MHLHSLGSVFILVLRHGLMSRRTHSSPPCRNVDVKVSSRQPDQPIILIGPPPGARPPTGLTNSVPLRSASHPLCPDPYDVSHHSSEGPLPRSLNLSITPTATPASLPLDGVTSCGPWIVVVIFSSLLADRTGRAEPPGRLRS